MKRVLILLIILIFQQLSYASINRYEKIAIVKSQRLISLGYYKKALKIIDEALEKYPNSDQLLTLKGQVYKETAKLKESLIFLRKALSINPDNKIAKELIQDVEQTIEDSKNKIILAALDWLSDKGIDFLMIFFGVLGGELLVQNLNSCKANETKKYIINYVSKYIELPSKYKKGKTIFILRCAFVHLLIYFTIISVFVVVILTAELLINVSYLEYVDSKGLWIHIGKLYLILSLFIIFLKLISIIKKIKGKKEEKEEIAIADMLANYLNENNIHLIRDSLEVLSLLKNRKIDSIFNAVLIDDDRETLKKIYEKIVKKDSYGK